MVARVAPELCAVQVCAEAVTALWQGECDLAVCIRCGGVAGVGCAILTAGHSGFKELFGCSRLCKGQSVVPGFATVMAKVAPQSWEWASLLE